MNNVNIRLRIVLIIVSLISLTVIVRIIYLSLIDSEDYNIFEKEEYMAKRGDIFDRNGHLFAISDELDSIYALPFEMTAKKEIAAKLSSILNIKEKTILEKLQSKKNFIWIKRQINPDQAERIVKEKIKGVYLKKEYKRFYPNKNLASQILGFCDIDNRGVEGIEKALDSYLIQNLNRENRPDIEQEAFNLTLTIDANIQGFAEYSIRNAVISEKAESGSLIFVDGKTGEILAMANYPDFDPNFYSNYNQKNFRNTAIFNQYEPGSVFKIFTIASLLDYNAITKNDFFVCDGVYHKGNLKVKCTGIHGPQNIAGIFKYSCNDATLQAANRIEGKVLYGYLKTFGFGETSSLLLTGEQSGLFRDISKWTDRSMLAVPIGQEISVNAMQMVRAATTFVNDGVMIDPFIVKNIFDDNKKIIKEFSRTEIRRVLRKGVSKDIIKAMESATDEIGGSARRLKIEGINFAAKSGTAEIFDPKTNKYSDKEVTSSLITVFPAENPRYIAYVVFHNVYHDEEGRVRWGGIIGSNLLNNFITRLTGYVDFGSENQITVKQKDVSISKQFKKLSKLPEIMPDLIGLSGGDAESIFSNLNVKVKINGAGLVYKQSPEDGTTLTKGMEIVLYLK